MEIQDGHQGLIFAEKIIILFVDHHSDHKVCPIVFILKMTHLPIHHHSDYRTSPIVFILSEHVAMYDNMPYG